MKTINKRILLLVSVTALFIAVVVLLMFSMFSHAEEYALKSVNNHLYNNGVLISAGDIVDSKGKLLAHTENGNRVYSEDADIRKAVLHIIGDDAGFISGGLQDTFRQELCGYNIIYGVNKTSNNTLKLSLDASLCATAYRALSPYKGCITVCNYKTGEIVCLASAPSYDMYNKPSDIEDNDDYDGVYINRLYGGLYTPGSIFKVVTAMSAIENIDDIFSRTFKCTGEYSVNNGKIICNDVHGTITFKQALNQSCNVAFAQIAIELGANKLQQAFKAAGLDISHDTCDRITTSSGVFKIDENSSQHDIGWAGIGQSTTMVNPYAYLTFMCAIANGGKTTEPHFVKESVSASSGHAVYTATPKDARLAINPSTASTLKEMMRSNVSDYYGDYMFGDLKMCGKTGTAERDDGLPHAWFAGFSYDDSFPYAIIAVLEDSGSGLKYAGNAAAKVLTALYAQQ